MGDPIKYTQSFNFSGYQSANPDSPLPGAQVDIQLEAIEQSTTELRDAVKDVRRSDGALANKSVGPDQISDALVLGFTLRGAWATDTDYAAGDGVTYSNAFYKANVAHTSSLGTRPDGDAVTWSFLLSFSAIATTDGSITPVKLATGQEAAFQAVIGTGAQLGTIIDALAAKTTPADADTMVLSDSENSLASKKITFLNVANGVFTRLGALLSAGTAKTTPVDADLFALADSESSNATKKFSWSNLKTGLITALGALVAGVTSKTTPVDADVIPIGDSAASNATKKLTFANLKTWIGVSLGGLVAGFTGKTTPVDADTILLSDSAASGASKKVTWANVKATLLAYLTPLHSPVSMTALATTSGTTKDFAIPAGCKRFTLSLQLVSTNGTGAKLVQLGTAGGVATSGYSGGGGFFGTSEAATTSSAGLYIGSVLASDQLSGVIHGVLLDASDHTWALTAVLNASTNFMFSSASSKTLSAALTTVRLTSVGPDTFDAGKVGLTYELG